MSDTPRMDKVERDHGLAWFGLHDEVGRYLDGMVKFREKAKELERELAAANAELGALKREVLALGTGLIRVRQQIFPAHDQTAVIRRDFPIYAAIAAKEQP